MDHSIYTKFKSDNERDTVSQNISNRDVDETFIDIRAHRPVQTNTNSEYNTDSFKSFDISNESLSIDAITSHRRTRATDSINYILGQDQYFEDSPKQLQENNPEPCNDMCAANTGLPTTSSGDFKEDKFNDNWKQDVVSPDNEKKVDETSIHAEIEKLIKLHYGKDITVARKPTKYFDAAVVYDQRDFQDVQLFIADVALAVQIELGEVPTIELFDSDKFASSVVMVVKDVIEKSGAVFVYLTANSQTETFQLFCEEAIGLSRLGMNSTCFSNTSIDRKWVLKPVHTQPQDRRFYKVPIGLMTSTGINWYDKYSEHTRSRVVSVMKEAIRRRREMEAHENLRTDYVNTTGKPVRTAYPPSFQRHQMHGPTDMQNRLSSQLADLTIQAQEYPMSLRQMPHNLVPAQNSGQRYPVAGQFVTSGGNINYGGGARFQSLPQNQHHLSHQPDVQHDRETHCYTQTDAMSSYTNSIQHAQSMPTSSMSLPMQGVYVNQPIEIPLPVRAPHMTMAQQTTVPTQRYISPDQTQNYFPMAGAVYPQHLRYLPNQAVAYQTASLVTSPNRQHRQIRHQLPQMQPVQRIDAQHFHYENAAFQHGQMQANDNHRMAPVSIGAVSHSMDNFPSTAAETDYQVGANYVPNANTATVVAQPMSHLSVVSKVTGELILEPNLSTDDVEIDNIVDCDGPTSDTKLTTNVSANRKLNQRSPCSHRSRRLDRYISSSSEDSTSSDGDDELQIPKSMKDNVTNIIGCRYVQLGSNNKIVEGSVSIKKTSDSKVMSDKSISLPMQEPQRLLGHQTDNDVKSQDMSTSGPIMPSCPTEMPASSPSSTPSTVYKDGANSVQDGPFATCMTPPSVNIDDNDAVSKAGICTDKRIAIESALRSRRDTPFQTVLKKLNTDIETIAIEAEENTPILYNVNSEKIDENVVKCTPVTNRIRRSSTKSRENFNIPFDESSSDDNNTCPSPTEMFSDSELFRSGSVHDTEQAARRYTDYRTMLHSEQVDAFTGQSVETKPTVVVVNNRILRRTTTSDLISTITNTMLAQSVASELGNQLSERTIDNSRDLEVESEID